ncbi:MAG: serine hydrolase domain-containing protein [Sphingobacterium sp.]|uniref:serine hydrolase domain-containing protein n=1 Tax=Sphingobacterium sp. JB170 TaxID=1434842 RepID=UPI00097ECD88|nr:serine hydrolase domain-containing protein [Sphingobacterium sp. JB170]SJN48434.1 Beta-lactamase [Sphingobacterium sp. JB170]
MRSPLLINLIAVILVPIFTQAQKNTSDLEATLDQLFINPNIPGAAILVSQQGETIFSYYNGLKNIETGEHVGPNSHFRMASVTKQITARAIHSLIQQGKIQATSSITEILDNLPEEFFSVQVRHLLQHSSGLPDYEDFIPKDQKKQLSDHDVLDLIIENPKLQFCPGDRFKYSNTGYCLLALIVEKVSRNTFAQYVRETLFKPIDIHDGLIYTPHSKIIDRAIGYHLEGADCAYADQSITSATQGDGGAYLATQEMQKWCRLITSSLHRDSDYRNQFNAGMQVKNNIRYQLGLFNFSDTDHHLHVFHSGESTGFQNIVYMDVHNKFSIIVFTNRDDFIVSKIFDALLAFYGRDHVMREQLGEPTFLWLNKVYSGN